MLTESTAAAVLLLPAGLFLTVAEGQCVLTREGYEM